MRVLLPSAGSNPGSNPDSQPDWFELYAVAAPLTGPHLRIGMVASLNGSVTDEFGWSATLGGPGDLQVFRTLRLHSDAVLVGAGTARTGRLGLPRCSAQQRQARIDVGRAPVPRLVLVSQSLRLDPALPVLAPSPTPAIVLTTSAAARRAAATLPGHLEVITAGDQEVDLTVARELLADRHGLHHLLCEGGPTLATAVLQTGAVDELCLSLAPTFTRGPVRTLLTELLARQELRLLHVLEDDGTLFMRYAL